ncbi:MAG: cell surface protein SprA [Bacteroidota bacterium]
MKVIQSLFISVSVLFVSILWASSPSFITITPSLKRNCSDEIGKWNETAVADSDTVIGSLKYPMQDQSYGIPFDNDYTGGLYLNDPSNIKTNITYDPDSNIFNINQKMGNINYRPSIYMSQEEYMEYEFRRSFKEYWKQRSHAESMTQQQNKNLIPPIKINSQIFDRIFGSNVVDIRPQGSAEIIFGVNSSFTANPAVPVKQRRITTFDFDEKIQLNLIGKIGERLKIATNYNTLATFDFENKMKLDWVGQEDDIIKKLEAGNVSLPLTSTLISGSQSLFGIKTQLQFGKTTVTSVISHDKGQKKEINIEGGAQVNSFEINGDNYEPNKHFFTAQYFKEKYDTAMKSLPVIVSGISITKIEVWITNTSSNINDTRNIIAMADLGEGKQTNVTTTVTIAPNNIDIPNNANNLLDPLVLASDTTIRNKDQASTILTGKGYQPVRDFERVLSARKLSTSEFSFNSKLGFVSLNTTVNPDQVVAVAYQYTYNGKTYQVGELSTDGIADPKCLFVKMLKSTIVSPRKDTLLWDLMMKNVYSIGAYQVKQEDFRLDVYYNNPSTGTDIPLLPEKGISSIEGKPLIQLMNMDRINTSGDAIPDGIFDFFDGVTINASNGRIYFPVREPFGDHIRKMINPNNNPTLIITENKYAYDQLYDSTKYSAQQFPDKNRFKIKGSYKSASGSEISLNAPSIPEGSVIVTAGGVPLTENVDYTVDYAIGKVKIINQGILQSGMPIKISFESNVLFGIQQKSLLGTHVDYRVNKDFNLGATALRLNERPIMQKVNIGDEPIKNTIAGFDGNYRSDFPWLTRLVDKLPLFATKEMSTITASGEVATLIPGHSRAINDKNNKGGNSYIDDFEGSQMPMDIKSIGAWTLASTPQGNNPLWIEGKRTDTIFGFNRAKMSWYVIDPMFTRQIQNLTPSYYNREMMSDNYQCEIFETQIFPKKISSTGQPIPISTLDLAFYPDERGPYNYDAEGVSGISAGTNANGKLKNPATRWGGIQRKIETNDFEAVNVEFIQLWVMDPFNSDLGSKYNNLQQTSGELIIHLGNISEDVLRDGKKSFENGLPISPSDITHPYDNTSWGRVPKIQAIVNAFDNNSDARAEQDIGLDGLKDVDEKIYFKKYVDAYSAITGSVPDDPSSDFYHYYRGNDYDAQSLGTLERYKNYNGLEGNSPVTSGSYPTASTTLPNTEDINRDNNLSENEGYYQYKIKVSPADFSPANVGKNFITDVVSGNGTTIDNQPVDVKWYQLKIPVSAFEAKYGNIEDFKLIRFIRVLMRGFDKPAVMRFARMELIRGEWRKYNYDITDGGEYTGDDDPGTNFDVSAVNYEENGTKTPVNYVLPPDIEQMLNYGPSNPVPLNEQAMALRVCNLKDGNARAAYKNVDFDVRSYKKLKMFIHAEAQTNNNLYDDDLTCFVRIGSDYTQNYYEYEIPLKVTPRGAYDNSNSDSRKTVWNEHNNMEIAFEDLQNIKQQRNRDILNGTVKLTQPYKKTITDANGNIRYVYVKGNPNLSAIKTIMIGVRNQKQTGDEEDDGLAKCAEVWINELRLSDFDEKGGWASTARVTAKLADLGTLTLSGNYSTPGWGSIEKKVSERQRETKYQYDIASQLQLHKFIPSEWGINLPMYVGYSESVIKPQYNPLDPDILLTPILKDKELPKNYRDSLSRITIDRTRRKSINFTNVKKDKSKNSKTNHVYDISNLAFNYSYSNFFNRSATIDYNNIRDYRGGLTYNFSTSPKNIQPFKKSKFLSKKYFALIKDFNFNPYPEKYSFLMDIDRHYSDRLVRNTTGENIPLMPYFDKKFTMFRAYDMKYDIAKALKLDFHADNTSRIMEPEGAIDTKEKKEQIKQNLMELGKNIFYNQHIKIDYTVPINKIPLINWITATTSYSADYKWTRAPFSADTMGHIITNGNQKQLNTQANLISLYNKIPYFKKVNQGIKNPKDKPEKKTSPKGKEPPKSNIGNPNDPKNPKDTTKSKKIKFGDMLFPQYAVRTIMMLKNVSVNYSNSEGTTLPGYNEQTQFFGLNQNDNYSSQFGLAPGLGFILGQQNNFGTQKKPFTDYAASQKWMVKTSSLNTPFTKNTTNNIAGKANIEPIPGFKIGLDANRNKSENYSEFFRWSDSLEDFVHQSPIINGNFSISFITWKTSFEKINKDYSSDAFTSFLNNRSIISRRFAEKYNNSSGQQTDSYFQGYGATSQQVLMFSFLSAYSGKNPNAISLKTFPNIPKPNWRITYDGLSKIKFLKKIFKTVTLVHAYRSSYSFTYTNNLMSGLREPGNPFILDKNNDFLFYEQINSVSISEQYAPLIKINITLPNNLQFNIEIKKDRNLSMSFANNQLTEINGRELSAGSGYRFKDIVLKSPFGKSKNKKSIKSDLNVKANFSIRNNLSMIRKVVEGVTQPIAGQTIYSLKMSADYVITQRINMRLFYDWLFTEPRISIIFRSSNTNAGVSLRFSLS